MTRILVTGARAPAALHLAKLLSDGGATVLAADCIRWPLTRGADFVEVTLRHPPPATHSAEFRAWLENTIAAHNIDLVVPSCEEVLHLAQAMTALGLQHKLYASGIDQLQQMHSKYDFIEGMRKLGFSVPSTTLIESSSDLKALGAQVHDLVLKPVWSRFADRVLIRPNLDDLKGISPTESDPWVAQEILEGQEVCIYAVGAQGKLGAWVAYRPTIRVGQGAGIHFTPVDDPLIADFLNKFFEATRWTGQVSFDVFLTPAGDLRPIECNPRATSGIHFMAHGPEFLKAMKGIASEAKEDVKPLQITDAMLIFGLPSALRNSEYTAWRQAWKEAQDATLYSSAGARRIMKAACFAELAWGAIKDRKSLLAGSTQGIEWGGARS